MKKALIILAFLLTATTLVTGRLQAAGGITSVITLPEGTNGEVQFGKNGRFRGDADFTFSTSTNRVTVSSAAITYATVSTASVTQLQFSDGTSMTSAASGGGDNLGTHIATKTISAPYGISATTIAASGVSLTYGVGAATGVFSGALSAASVTDSGLTSGRVPYAGTGGLLQDASAFTFNGTTLSVSNVSVSTASIDRLRFSDGTNMASTTTFLSAFALKTDPGVMNNIYEDTLVAPGTFTITGLDMSYDNLKIVLYGRLGQNSNVYATIRFNGNLPQSQITQGSGSSATSSHFTGGQICPMAYSDLTAGFFSYCEATVIGYSTTNPRTGSAFVYGIMETNVLTAHATYHDNNSGALTTLGIGSVSSNTFDAGTHLVIYGYND